MHEGGQHLAAAAQQRGELVRSTACRVAVELQFPGYTLEWPGRGPRRRGLDQIRRQLALVDMPERRPMDRLRMHRGADRLQRSKGLQRGRTDRRIGIVLDLEPVDLHPRRCRGKVEVQGVELGRQLRPDVVARDLHRLTCSGHLSQLAGGCHPLGQVHLGGDADAQELRVEGLARQHRLPQHQPPHTGTFGCQLGRHDRAQAQTQ